MCCERHFLSLLDRGVSNFRPSLWKYWRIGCRRIGGTVSGVTVKVSNGQSGAERTVTTNDSGTYRITALLPGDYDVATDMVGFKPAIKHATVNVGRDVTVDFMLEVGSANQSITVQAEAVAVNLTDSKVDDIITPEDITSLPLNGRNAYEMAKLVSGVTQDAQLL